MSLIRELWKNETYKTIFIVAIVIGASYGSYLSLQLAMGTPTPLVVVTSESMSPNLHTGDLLIIQHREASDIKVGDIVVYTSDWHPESPVVHRVIEIINNSGTLEFITKGDANPVSDPGFRTIEDIIGVVVFRIPYIGYVSLWLRNPIILITVIMLIAIVLLYPSDEDNNNRHYEPEEDPILGTMDP